MDWIPSWLRPIPPPPAQRGKDPITQEISPVAAPLPASTILDSVSLDLRDDTKGEEGDGEEDDDDDTPAGPMQSIPITGFAIGFCTGLYQAGKQSSLVFMAENAHRRPDTVQGWYFYNKTKNYRVLLAGVKGGLKTGTRVGIWTLAYVGIEYGVTRLQQDMAKQKGGDIAMQRTRLIAGGIAGLGIASGASLIYRLSGPIARRALLVGLVTGSSVGALRDAQQLISQKKDNNVAIV